MQSGELSKISKNGDSSSHRKSFPPRCVSLKERATLEGTWRE